MALIQSRRHWPERAVTVPILIVLVALAAVSWGITTWQAAGSSALMDAGVPMALGAGGRLAVGSAALFLVIWLVMMAAMMFPSMWPVVLTYAGLRSERGGVSVPLFVVGYLLVWEAFGVLAYLLYVVVGALATGNAAIAASLPYVTGGLVVVAGLYQLTPLKNACLANCRGSVAFLRAQWESGSTGAVRLGLRHGLYCIGSSSGLMLVLLALGMMDLRWLATVAILIAVEKLGPRTRLLPLLIGVGLIGLGVAVVISPMTSMQSV